MSIEKNITQLTEMNSILYDQFTQKVTSDNIQELHIFSSKQNFHYKASSVSSKFLLSN